MTHYRPKRHFLIIPNLPKWLLMKPRSISSRKKLEPL
jgi:hypothetical protein